MSSLSRAVPASLSPRKRKLPAQPGGQSGEALQVFRQGWRLAVLLAQVPPRAWPGREARPDPRVRQEVLQVRFQKWPFTALPAFLLMGADEGHLFRAGQAGSAVQGFPPNRDAALDSVTGTVSSGERRHRCRSESLAEEHEDIVRRHLDKPAGDPPFGPLLATLIDVDINPGNFGRCIERPHLGDRARFQWFLGHQSHGVNRSL